MSIESNLDKIFVSSYIAKKLKELGFDEECLAYYHNHAELDLVKNNIFTKNSEQNLYHGDCAAPTWEQVIDWFLNKKHVNINVYIPFKAPRQWMFNILNIDYIIYNHWSKTKKHVEAGTNNILYNTYYEARKEAILHAINIEYEISMQNQDY